MRRPHPAWLASVPALLAPAAAHAAEGGLEIFPDERIFVLIALFIVLVWPVDRLLFRPLLRVLDERRERIEGAREKADQLSRDADDVLGRYESAVQAARQEAEASRRASLDEARRNQNRITAGARGEAEGEVTRARGEVARALAEARTQLRREAEPLARAAASQVLGRALS